jgi:tetratricopeptide (TPR) repeat protein
VVVKGKSQPIKICRLVREKQVQPSIAALPLVGRDRELAALTRELRSSQSGAFRHVHVSGEPGIGKSRLVEEFAERAASVGQEVIRLSFQSYESGTPFAAWRSMLTSRQDARAEAALRAIEGGSASDDPRTRREATISALVAYIDARAPCLLLVEDEYWADESSLGVIERLTSMRIAGLVICVTSRFQPTGTAKPNATIQLQPLGDGASAQIIQEMIGNKDGRIDIQAIAERARGNPLFLVEMMRAPDLGGSVPDTLNDVVTARIDALSPDERQVLRVAAVAGDQFAPAFVEQLARPTVGDRTVTILPTLVQRGFTSIDGEGPIHRFTHSILSEVAYQSASYAFRRRMHARAGKIIESESVSDEVAVSEKLLHHFERAGNVGKSVKYASMAGDRSAGVFANAEALAFYERGLSAVSKSERPADVSVLLERKADVLESSGHHSDAVAALQESLEAFAAAPRTRPRFAVGRVSLTNREPLLYQKLAVATEHTSDYDAALEWLERARSTLAPRDARLRAKVYATTCAVLLRKGQYTEAMDWGKRAIRAARGASDLRQVAYTQHMLGTALAEAGHLREGVRLLRRGVKAYHELGDYRGQASANSNLGSTYLLLGMYDAALYHYEVAQIADGRTGDDIDTAIVQNNMAETLLLMDREDEAILRLKEALAIASREPDLVDLQGWAEVTMARCLRAKGDLEESGRHLSQGRRLLRSVGSTGLLTEALVDFAEQALAEGDSALGMRSASRALRQAVAQESRLAEARARRVMGECLIVLGRPTEGETMLVEALHGCRRANAEHEEARVSVALGKVYLATGRRGGARRLMRRAHRIYTQAGASRQAEASSMLLAEAGG